MEYRSLLHNNRRKWVTKKTPMTAVWHSHLVIRAVQLRTRHEQDIGFSHKDLTAGFAGFMKHAIDVLEAFEKADGGPSKSRKSNRHGEKTKKTALAAATWARRPPKPAPEPSRRPVERRRNLHQRLAYCHRAKAKNVPLDDRVP